MKAPGQEQTAIAATEAPHFEKVTWYTDPGLRKLYLLSIFGLMVASATTGFDGYGISLARNLQFP